MFKKGNFMQEYSNNIPAVKENVDEAQRIEVFRLNSVDGSRRSLYKYTNNTEYRQCIRQFFQMDSQQYPETIHQIPDLDDETRDEISYDEAAASKKMDYILILTSNIPIFQNMYNLAAGKMFSVDPEIGLAVLLSYDYFQLFNDCFVEFLKENPDLERAGAEDVGERLNSVDGSRRSLNETSQSYIEIMKKLR